MKMLKHTIKYIGPVLLMGLVALLSASLAQADSLTVAVNDGAYLLNADSSRGWVLLKLNIPGELTGAEIIFAELRVPLTASIPDSSALAVECRSLLISWDPAEVTWNDLGDSPSGEIIAEHEAQFSTASEGEQEAYFDITEMAKAWQDSSLANNGILLYCNPIQQPYFAYSKSEGAPFAIIKFEYSH
jgi:hypothetical protein